MKRVDETLSVYRSELAKRTKESPREVCTTPGAGISSCCRWSGGIISRMVQDLMLEWVEKRFGAQETAHLVERLSNNWSPYYTAKDTVASRPGASLPLHAGPQDRSRGMSEASAKTFKQDYVHIQESPNAEAILKNIYYQFNDFTIL